MKKNIVAVFLMSAFIAPTMADKPDWAGKGKSTVEHKSAQESAVEGFDDEAERLKEKKDKKDKTKQSHEPKGLEKQKDKKSEQTQNEIDKGSEKGKESREKNSRKWWKFWGD